MNSYYPVYIFSRFDREFMRPRFENRDFTENQFSRDPRTETETENQFETETENRESKNPRFFSVPRPRSRDSPSTGLD